MDDKKEKLFKFIEEIKEKLTEEEKNEIVEYQKWLNEQNKPSKERELPWMIFRGEKRQYTREERPEISQEEIRLDEDFYEYLKRWLKTREKRRKNPPPPKKKKKRCFDIGGNYESRSKRQKLRWSPWNLLKILPRIVIANSGHASPSTSDSTPPLYPSQFQSLANLLGSILQSAYLGSQQGRNSPHHPSIFLQLLSLPHLAHHLSRNLDLRPRVMDFTQFTFPFKNAIR